MKLLHVNGESQMDRNFYVRCAERISGLWFEEHEIQFARSRRGEGDITNFGLLEGMLRKARGEAQGEMEIYFIASLDNDRSPHPQYGGAGEFPGRKDPRDDKNSSRHDRVLAIVHRVLGHDRKSWKVKGAVAVPVEMIESWWLQALEEKPLPLPHFARKDQQIAKTFYRETRAIEPPDQLKDLVDLKQEEMGCASEADFMAAVLAALDVERLASQSLSFKMFKDWLEKWGKH